MKGKQPFLLTVTDRVLLVTALGVWTVTDTKDYVRQFRKLVKPLITAPWAIILDARYWQMSPAEVFDILLDNTAWCFQHQLMYAVTILPDDNLLRWQFFKATEMAKPDGFVSLFAENELAADAILRAAGYLN
jgi:hypothetical protein